MTFERSPIRALGLAAALLLATTPTFAQTDIHSVDFRNFTYDYGLAGDEQPPKLTVKDGKYALDEEGNQIFFEVIDVIYGDLTGDGNDEAIVRTHLNTGGTGQFTDGIIFTMRGGKPVEIGSLGIGDRADGGIHDIKIKGGHIVVDRYGQENSGACCPEYIERATFGLKGNKFVEVAEQQVRGYQYYANEQGATHRVRFLRGTSAATLAGSTNLKETYALGARKGQTLHVAFSTKDSTAEATVKAPDGKVLATLKAGAEWSGPLPASGDYTVAVTSAVAASSDADTYYALNVSIQ